MSDTPITDAFIIQNHVYPIGYHAMISTSRALERELNAANERIKRLEEAGDWIVTEDDTFARLKRWTAAKEAKP